MDKRKQNYTVLAQMKTAIYPGTFDPLTSGHLDVLSRACSLFDKVIIGVAENVGKNPVFGVEDRLRLIEENIGQFPNVKAAIFNGLLVDFARKMDAIAVIRGLRAVSDFEYEFQLAQMNRHLDSDIETIFLMPNEKYFFTSSTLIKQVFTYTDRVTDLVPENVRNALIEKFKKA